MLKVSTLEKKVTHCVLGHSQCIIFGGGGGGVGGVQALLPVANKMGGVLICFGACSFTCENYEHAAM